MRYGGEEFAVILSQISAQKALLIAEQIRERVEALVLEYKQSPVKVTISIGLAQFPLHLPESSKQEFTACEKHKLSLLQLDQLSSDIFSQADKALYKAKHSGRNKCVVYGENKS
jgi:PleD family two-component response regulator